MKGDKNSMLSRHSEKLLNWILYTFLHDVSNRISDGKKNVEEEKGENGAQSWQTFSVSNPTSYLRLKIIDDSVLYVILQTNINPPV